MSKPRTKTIEGEKKFTPSVRTRTISKAIKARVAINSAFFDLLSISVSLKHAETCEDLEKIHKDWRSATYKLRRVCDDVPDLYPYYEDNRKLCHYCGKKSFGGCEGFMLSDPERFTCYRDACDKKYDRDVAKDEREHPKMYAAERKRVAAARKKSRRRRCRVPPKAVLSRKPSGRFV